MVEFPVGAFLKRRSGLFGSSAQGQSPLKDRAERKPRPRHSRPKTRKPAPVGNPPLQGLTGNAPPTGPKTRQNTLVEFPPLQRSGSTGNITRRGPCLRLGSRYRFFKPLPVSPPFEPLSALFHAEYALGVAPSGYRADGEGRVLSDTPAPVTLLPDSLLF